jgi:hypothetical protein
MSAPLMGEAEELVVIWMQLIQTHYAQGVSLKRL